MTIKLAILFLGLLQGASNANAKALICADQARVHAAMQLKSKPGKVVAYDFMTLGNGLEGETMYQIEFYKVEKAPNYLLVETAKAGDKECTARFVYSK